jgi:signal transduction histidine kinase
VAWVTVYRNLRQAPSKLAQAIAGWMPKSLAGRAIALSTVWAALSILVASYFIGQFYSQISERNLRTLLATQIASLIVQIEISNDGKLSGIPDLGDTQYLAPNSGKYWIVEPVTSNVVGSLRSNSIGKHTVPMIDLPWDASFFRYYQVPGPDGKTLEVLENLYQQISFNKNLAGEKRELIIRVMHDVDLRQVEITNFKNRLYSYLLLLGLGTIFVNALAILLGLNPLRRTEDSLRLIREGKAQRLDGEFPSEIAPLASEMNALIDNNRRIMERARTQVGNLAHSLKTPLAVIMNEGNALGGAKGKTVSEQANAMQGQIQHYLQRARIAAQRDSVVFRAPATPILERLVRVMQKLNPEKSFELLKPAHEIVFAGEGTDLEEIAGNLLENAAKWGRKRVSITLDRAQRSGNLAMFSIEIGDDGPGLTPEQIKDGIKRGKRLDETKPGTGLGLSIVQDTVKEYGGALVLGKSALGGLSAKFMLPMAE